MDQAICQHHTSKEKVKMCDAFGDMVRESLQKRADLIKDDELPNLQLHLGVVVSKQKNLK